MGKSKLFSMLLVVAVAGFFYIRNKDKIFPNADNTETKAAQEEIIAEDVLVRYSIDKTITKAQIDKKLSLWFSDRVPSGKSNFDEFPADLKKNFLKTLIQNNLLDEAAAKTKLGDNEIVKRKVEEISKQIIREEYLLGLAKANVKEDEIKKVYAEFLESFRGREEVKVSYILLDDKATAEAVHKLLEDGASFQQIARERSRDAEVNKGEPIGYFGRGEAIKEFEDVAFSLEKGEFSTPFKSNIGWHIVKLEDKRISPPPSYDEMRPRITRDLQAKFIQDYLDKLVKKANPRYFIEEKNNE